MAKKIADSTIDQAKADIVEVIGRYVKLTPRGKEFDALCPFHKEKSPSFSITPDKGIYYCFGCGAGGDAIQFVMDYESVDFKAAVSIITGKIETSGEAPKQRQVQRVEEEPEWVPMLVPADLAQKPMDLLNRKIDGVWHKLEATKRWAYRDADGQLIGFTCRFALPGGGKDVMPQTYCVNTKTGETQWRWQSFTKPRPVYRLDVLAANPKAQVLIVEGEKAADAAQGLFLGLGVPQERLVVIAWAGGGKAVKFTNWEPLAGRAVALWPDADQQLYPDNHQLAGQLVPFLEQPGASCMLDIAGRIQSDAVKFVLPPEGVEDGWDLADALPDGFSLLGHLKANALPVAEVRARFTPNPESIPPGDEPMPWDDQPDYSDYAEAHDAGEIEDPIGAPATAGAVPPATGDGGAHDNDELVKNGYFTILGYDGPRYYFFQHEKRQIMELSKKDFGDTGLIELGDVNWWEDHFPGSKGGIDKRAAAQWIFRTANSRGIYDPTRVRGRGAWLDKGRIVYHHGGYLSVDGLATEITKIKSGYVYPMAHSLPDPSPVAMTDEEGAYLVRVAEKVRWSKPASAALMAGWTMLAPICGALSWRPHIWITGGAGSGKTTVQKFYCAGLTKDLAVYALGGSSEAGIRQRLKADALPVLIDEAESNNERERQRMDSIIAMIRQTSSETQAEILKGTVSGDSQHYQIRSMFCLASINVNLPGKADIDRLTKLVVNATPPGTPGAQEHWAELEAELTRIDEDPEISGRLLARALSLMPVILESVKVFRKAAAKYFGTQRDGDQFGTLLAGCWCLQKHHVPTEPEAIVLIKGYDWAEHIEDHDQNDAGKALEGLLSSKIRMTGSVGDLTVYELIREASPLHREGGKVDAADAAATLRRHGIIPDFKTDILLFGTSVSTLKELIEKMPSITDLRDQLLRINGAIRIDTTHSFNGSKSKCIGIPLKPILGEKEAQDELPI